MAMSKEAATLETGSDSEKDGMCVPCLDDGEHRQAAKYCIDCGHLVCHSCVVYHRRFKQLKDHKLADISAAEDLKLSQKLSNLLICQNHPGKTVELVCKDHDVLCCLTCATVSHRGCQEVVEVTMAASDIKQNPAANEMKAHLTAAKDHMGLIVKHHEECKADIVKSADETIPQKLQEFKKKLIQAFEVVEQKILATRTARKASLAAKYDHEKAKWAKHVESVDEAINLLSCVQQNGSPVHLFIVANKLQKTIKEVDAVIADQGNELPTETIFVKKGADLLKVLSCEPVKVVELSVTKTTTSIPKYKYDPNVPKNDDIYCICCICNNPILVPTQSNPFICYIKCTKCGSTSLVPPELRSTVAHR